MTLGGAAQVAAAHCPNGLWTPQSAAIAPVPHPVHTAMFSGNSSLHSVMNMSTLKQLNSIL